MQCHNFLLQFFLLSPCFFITTIHASIPASKKTVQFVDETKTPTSPPLDHQGDGIEAINTGNVVSFKDWIQNKADLTSANHEGFTPYEYLERLTKKCCNPRRAAHQAMLKMADLHLATTDLTALFIKIKNEKK